MFEYLLQKDPYSLKKEEKEKLLLQKLLELCKFHYKNCLEYKKILDVLEINFKNINSLNELPFIPVRLFKKLSLKSVDDEKIIKILTSSGTSGQNVSKVFLDAINISNQTKTLNKIISSFIENSRLPLLFLDTQMVKKDRLMYSARGAGIVGFSMFGKDSQYALNDQMELDLDTINVFFEKYKNSRILMFGYTYIIWQFIIRALEKQNMKFNLKDAVLFHIGGWKKLKDEEIAISEFNQRIKNSFGNIKIYNYYGMAEQLGSVYVECEYGHMHASNFSDIIIRKPGDFSICNVGEKGLIELVSVIPTSYPGHCILSEDEGEIIGIDDCACGRYGKYFKIHGRIKNAEIRGCSDTYEKR